MERLISRLAVLSQTAVFVGTLGLTTVVSMLRAADPAPAESNNAEATPSADQEPPLPGLKRLSPAAQVWIDLPNKQLVLRGEIVLRRGPLELLACLKNTKEHEAVVSVETKAYVVHAGLLACGATVGNPAKFVPEFTPARGTEVEVLVEWTDAAGKKQRKDAREWVKNAKTGEALKYPWVFGGSGFWVDPQDNKRHYQAEDGDLICISNFPSAMLDVPVESSAANSSLLFEAFTDNIPPEKTKVLIFLKPKLDKKPAAGEKPADAKPSTPVGATTKSAAEKAVVASPVTPVAAPVTAKTTAAPIFAAESPVVVSTPTPPSADVTPMESGNAPAPSQASPHSSHKTVQTPRNVRWLRRNASYRRSL